MATPVISPKTPHTSQKDMGPKSPSYFGLVVDPDNTTVKSSGANFANHERERSSSPPFPLQSPKLKSPSARSPQSRAALGPGFSNDIFGSSPSGVARAPFSAKSNSWTSFAADEEDTNPDSPRYRNRDAHSGSKVSHTVDTRAAFAAADLNSPFTRSPKRLLSSDATQSAARRPVRQSSGIPSDESPSSKLLGSPPSRHNDKLPRLSLHHSDSTFVGEVRHHRAESSPVGTEAAAPMMISPEKAWEMVKDQSENVLLLDLRVSTQYAASRIEGALNLCIPTTLIKRPSYNVQRLCDTFKNPNQRKKFEGWCSCNAIVVYDNASGQIKEATSSVNVLRKFTNEGWSGQGCIIRGGFVEFASKLPQHVDNDQIGYGNDQRSNLTIHSVSRSVPPVVGGCPIPNTDNAANPFFGNIRQNTDLIDGVGQQSVRQPHDLTERSRDDLPKWLREAVDDRNKGKVIADKFLQIEKREQRRMQKAFMGSGAPETPGSINRPKDVQVAGIEKGNKNRYNNIFPFEHSRVKLQGIERGSCDYVNASFVSISRSHKRYIATQGPIPATFNDFWTMVWQRDVRVLVMLTAEQEGGQVKAHNYWKSKHYGPIKLHMHSEHRVSLEPFKMNRLHERLESTPKRSSYMDDAPRNKSSDDSGVRGGSSPGSSPESDHSYVTVRRFTISHDNLPFERMRSITQLQYSSWPDFGAPAHPSHLLGLVEQCDSAVRSTSSASRDEPTPPAQRPVLVHCSAGCGRTGTFCTVDTVVDMLKRQRQHRMQKMRSGVPMDLDHPEPGTSAAQSSKWLPHETHLAQGAPAQASPEADTQWLERDDVDLVEKTVEEFRSQRLSMVQSLRQYVLCYETILEWNVAHGEPRTA